MSEAAKLLLEQAMNLPPAERLSMARELLRAAANVEQDEWDEEWLAELDRRLNRLRASEEPAMSWKQVQDRLRALAPQ